MRTNFKNNLGGGRPPKPKVSPGTQCMQQRSYEGDEGDWRNGVEVTHNNEHFEYDDEGRGWRSRDVRPTCEKYRRGVCPHGISGRTLVNHED